MTTKKTKTKKTKKSTSEVKAEKFWVVVEYKGYPENAFALDEEIEKAAKKYGLRETGTGFGFGVRDLSFESQKTDQKTMDALMKKLQSDLKKIKIRPRVTDYYPLSKL